MRSIISEELDPNLTYKKDRSIKLAVVLLCGRQCAGQQWPQDDRSFSPRPGWIRKSMSVENEIIRRRREHAAAMDLSFRASLSRTLQEPVNKYIRVDHE